MTNVKDFFRLKHKFLKRMDDSHPHSDFLQWKRCDCNVQKWNENDWTSNETEAFIVRISGCGESSLVNYYCAYSRVVGGRWCYRSSFICDSTKLTRWKIISVGCTGKCRPFYSSMWWFWFSMSLTIRFVRRSLTVYWCSFMENGAAQYLDNWRRRLDSRNLLLKGIFSLIWEDTFLHGILIPRPNWMSFSSKFN